MVRRIKGFLYILLAIIPILISIDANIASKRAFEYSKYSQRARLKVFVTEAPKIKIERCKEGFTVECCIRIVNFGKMAAKDIAVVSYGKLKIAGQEFKSDYSTGNSPIIVLPEEPFWYSVYFYSPRLNASQVDRMIQDMENDNFSVNLDLSIKYRDSASSMESLVTTSVVFNKKQIIISKYLSD